MPKKQLLLCALFIISVAAVQSQELMARVSINSSQVSSQVDKKIFQTLQTAIVNFLNNKKWTDETYQPNEKINCNFLIIIAKAEDGVYTGSMTVQAARPVYSATYVTPLIIFKDEDIKFRYVEFQPIEFNENRIAGSDALTSNLPASLAFYVYVVLGLDYNSFSLRGGDPWFQKAQTIISSAPDGRNISGWRSFDGQRNRYWLIENLTNNKYSAVHDAMYSYYRLGLDHMYENEPEARAAVLNSITQLNTLNNDQSNSMIIPFFFQGRTTEIVRIFRKAPPEEKQRVQEMMSRLDISNANTYKQELK